MKRRTDKTFEEYNDYHDRPFGLKWGTAFALDELTKVINHNKNNATKNIKALPQMSRSEIDEVLQYAFLKTKKISIQLNDRDENESLLNNLEGYFQGNVDSQSMYLQDQPINWESIRNIKICE